MLGWLNDLQITGFYFLWASFILFLYTQSVNWIFYSSYRCTHGRLFICMFLFMSFFVPQTDKCLAAVATFMRVFVLCVSFHGISCCPSGWRISRNNYTCEAFHLCVSFHVFSWPPTSWKISHSSCICEVFFPVCVISCCFMLPNWLKDFLQ